MITLKTESNTQYMALRSTPENLKVTVKEYNRLQANHVADASVTINGTAMEDFELEEFFDGRLSSLEFYAGLLKAVEDGTIFLIRGDRKAIVAMSAIDRDQGFDDGFAGLQVPENQKDNWFYGEGHSDGKKCAYLCRD